jgi:glycosyltransferase involved in cell wall biosynthesis
MKTAVVHDFFTQVGGAEKVAQEMYRMLPKASLFATVALPECVPAGLKGVKIHTSWMQNLPMMEKMYRLYFFLYPFGVGNLDLSSYDLVLSSSIAYAKGVRVKPDAVHVCYCHTPMRWVWNYDSYIARESFGWSQRALLPLVIQGLKQWDIHASRQPDHFIANSTSVAALIHKVYGRTAEVIHPPIDTKRFCVSYEHEGYYLVLARLLSYKRADLAVRACTERNLKLIVIGTGPDRNRLERMAGPSVTFLKRVSDSEVERCAASCKALIFTGEEDFGMAPIELAATGKPTIAFRAGGALETIVENVTGLFFDHQTAESLGDAIERFERQEWSPDIIRKHSEGFSIGVFRDRFRSFLRRIGTPVDMQRPISSSMNYPDIFQGVHAS